MLKRRISAIATVLALVFTTTACRNTENLHGDVDSKDALHICIDIGGYPGDGTFVDPQEQLDINDFMLSLKQTGGLENVVFEIIPNGGAERDTMIMRIRTELMSGSGPDVFIVDCTFNADIEKAVFPFPEKVMEAGLFLPLDEYMENNTEFTEWDKQQPVVLTAGRNEEGQQIIPLSYTFPVQVCGKSSFTMELQDAGLSWQDTLADPALADMYAELNDCIDWSYAYDMQGNKTLACSYDQYFEHVVGKLADFEDEELLFTEEELLMRINEIKSLQENSSYKEKRVFTNQFMGSRVVNNDITMMPMYSDDGGICVSIRNFAAVNRNTKHPEDAYRVIDVLLHSNTQLTKSLYRQGLCSSGNSIPLYDEAFHIDARFDSRCFLEETYDMFIQVKGQITAANFRSSLSYDLYMLFVQCCEEEDPAMIEALVHAAYDSMQRKVRE